MNGYNDINARKHVNLILMLYKKCSMENAEHFLIYQQLRNIGIQMSK